MKQPSTRTIIIAIVVVVLAIAVFNYALFSKTGLALRGALQKTVPSASYSVTAIGANLRAYTFTDAAGRVCTSVHSENGVWGDCDFLPSGERFTLPSEVD